MASTLELYLTHQVIRGDLSDDSGHRVIDVLNAATSKTVMLTNGLSASLHAPAPPHKLDAVRVQRSQILLIVPQTPETLPPRRFRVGYVERRPMGVSLGLGPFIVSGIAHVNTTEQNPLGSLEHDASGRFFIPVTQACLKSQYDPRWSVKAELIFLNRAAICYSHLLTPTATS